MTLYELIDKVDEQFTPDTHSLRDYIINTSDDNGGFLRTCFTRKRIPLVDHEIPDLNMTVIGFDMNFDGNVKNIVENYTEGFTPLKLQLWYSDRHTFPEHIYLNRPLFSHNYIIAVNPNQDYAEIHVGKGWYPLVVEGFDKIDRAGGYCIEYQEKYGTLRFDVANMDSTIEEIIDEIEEKSSTICENCGAEGKAVELKSGWILTLCDNCIDEMNEKM